MSATSLRLIRWAAALVLSGLIVAMSPSSARVSDAQETVTLPPPVVMTAEQDHQRMMRLLHIITLRPGADGNHPQAPNAANYDESKANPYPNLPDPLTL